MAISSGTPTKSGVVCRVSSAAFLAAAARVRARRAAGNRRDRLRLLACRLEDRRALHIQAL